MSSQGVYVGNVNQYVRNMEIMGGGFQVSASKSLGAKAEEFRQPPALMHFAKILPLGFCEVISGCCQSNCDKD